MDQLIYASLSHTHYWYEVGILKVPAIYSKVKRINRGQISLPVIPNSYLDTLLKAGSESIEATLRRRRILFAGDLWRAWRIRDCRSA